MTQRRKRFLILAAIILGFATLLTGVELATGAVRAAYALHEGARLLNENNLPEAIARCDEAIALRPEWAPPYDLRASAHARLGDWEKAVADGVQACRLSPKQLNLQRNLAKSLVGRGTRRADAMNYDDAVTDYERALELDPNSAAARTSIAATLNNRGVARGNAGDHDGAIADLRRSVEVQARIENDALHDRRLNLSAAFATRGRLRLDRNDLNRTVEDFGEALKADPASEVCRDLAAAALNRRGRDEERKGRREVAMVDYTHTIELYPNPPKADPKPASPKIVVAEFLPMLSPLSTFAGFASSTAARSPHAEAYFLRGAARLADNELDEAAEDLTRAIALSTGYAEAYESLGLVRLHQMDEKEAERLFAIFRKLRPGNGADLKVKIEAIRRRSNP